MYKITSTSEAVQILIASATRPPQIDYVSPATKAKEYAAEDYIDALPDTEKEEAAREINAAIEAYEGVIFIDKDGKEYSPADLDAMF